MQKKNVDNDIHMMSAMRFSSAAVPTTQTQEETVSLVKVKGDGLWEEEEEERFDLYSSISEAEEQNSEKWTIFEPF
jgi:hypothetical protein